MKEYLRPGFRKKEIAAENKRLTKVLANLDEAYQLLGRVNYGQELDLARAQVAGAYKLVNAVRISRGKPDRMLPAEHTVDVLLEECPDGEIAYVGS